MGTASLNKNAVEAGYWDVLAMIRGLSVRKRIRFLSIPRTDGRFSGVFNGGSPVPIAQTQSADALFEKTEQDVPDEKLIKTCRKRINSE